MPGKIGKLSGYKLIEELPPPEPGKLGQRTAVIKLQLDSGQMAEIDAEHITNMRTGAAGVLGMEFLAPRAKNIAILGTGKIAKALALCAIEFGVDTIHIFSRKPENRQKFKEHLVKHLVFDKVVLHDSIPSCVSDVEAILTAVPTPEPVLFFRDLPPRVHISVMGGDSRTAQLDSEILKKGVVIPDNLQQCQRSGEFKLALKRGYFDEINFAQIDGRIAHIGDAALGKINPDKPITITYFTGLAIQDLHAAQMVYEKFTKTPSLADIR